MVAMIFFPSGHPHLTNRPLPPSEFVHFCLTSSPPNVLTSVMDGPYGQSFKLHLDRLMGTILLKLVGNESVIHLH